MTTRILRIGDTIKASPCVVTIHSVGKANARGLCSTCEVDHLISTPRYESGQGPWKPAEND